MCPLTCFPCTVLGSVWTVSLSWVVVTRRVCSLGMPCHLSWKAGTVRGLQKPVLRQGCWCCGFLPGLLWNSRVSLFLKQATEVFLVQFRFFSGNPIGCLQVPTHSKELMPAYGFQPGFIIEDHYFGGLIFRPMFGNKIILWWLLCKKNKHYWTPLWICIFFSWNRTFIH